MVSSPRPRARAAHRAAAPPECRAAPPARSATRRRRPAAAARTGSRGCAHRRGRSAAAPATGSPPTLRILVLRGHLRSLRFALLAFVILIYQMQRISRSEFIPCAFQAFRITRFQFARDRVIGDSQVRADDVNVAALELIADNGKVGLGFVQTLFHAAARPGRDRARSSAPKSGPGSKASTPIGLVHRCRRPRGGNQRGPSPAVPRGAAGRALGPRRQAGRPAAPQAARRPARHGPRLCQRPRFPPQRRRVLALLRPRRCARLPRLQDQGRPSRFRAGPASARAC